MSLDQNLFTLTFTPNADDPTLLDLIDASGVLHYRRQRVPGPTYKMNVYDPISESLLTTVTAPSATSKHKTIELFNPSLSVELKYVGTITFKWAFKWEEHEFEWKREECYMIRKPDPPVLVAVTKEPAGRIKTSTVQLLDYNLNRFDIDDRKGLEIVLLAALLTFQDSSDEYHTPPADATPNVNPFNRMLGARQASGSTPAPIIPPKPAPRTGMDRVAELHAIRGDSVNEVTVEEEIAFGDWALYCAKLLQDESMLFITIRSAVAEQVPKVLQVVEETKRLRHKAGLSEEEDLHQYVLYETPKNARKGPKRINLNDPAPIKGMEGYAPPASLAVHLSKISMPELQPRASATQVTSDKGGKKDDRKADKLAKQNEKERERAAKKEKDRKGKGKAKNGEAVSPDRADDSKKLTKPSPKPSPGNSRLNIHANQTHPHQPSPSPSQLNNPAIYSAPPLQPRPRPPNISAHTRPQSTYGGPPMPVPPRARPLSFFGGGGGGPPPMPTSPSPSFYGAHVPPHGGGMGMPLPMSPSYSPYAPPFSGALNRPPPPPPPPGAGGQSATSAMVSGLFDRLSKLRS